MAVRILLRFCCCCCFSANIFLRITENTLKIRLHYMLALAKHETKLKSSIYDQRLCSVTDRKIR